MNNSNDGRNFRVEKDALGNVEVPIDHLWGAQTERSHRNFPIGVARYPLGPVLMLSQNPGSCCGPLFGPRHLPVTGSCGIVGFPDSHDAPGARLLAGGRRGHLYGATPQLLKEHRHGGWLAVYRSDAIPTNTASASFAVK